MAPNGSQRLPTAPYDYKHTLLLFSSSMTPTDFHLLPPRELTPQPNSQARPFQKQWLKLIEAALPEAPILAAPAHELYTQPIATFREKVGHPDGRVGGRHGQTKPNQTKQNKTKPPPFPASTPLPHAPQRPPFLTTCRRTTR